MFTSFKRILNLGWINVSRNMGLSLAAVFIISITLIFVTLIFIVKDFGEILINDIEDKINVSVYFKEGVDEETILEVQREILEIEETKSVDYLSRGKAFDIFIERHKENPVIMASLAEVGNPFLASLNIKSKTSEGYQQIVTYLNESPSYIFFEKIDYTQRKDVIESIFNVTSLTRRIGIFSVIIFSLIAFLIVFNVVRLTIYGMKEEIKTMRLVGVSCSFIRSLFVFQGVIIGAIAFLVAFMTTFGFGIFFGDRLMNLIPNLDVFAYLKNNFLFILSVQLVVGIGLGALSSMIATTKHLKN